MKMFRIISWWVTLILLLMLATGCQTKSAEATQTPAQAATDPAATEEPTAPEPTEDPVQRELTEKYLSAVEKTFGDSYALEVQYESSVTVAGKTYRESHEITRDFHNVGSENFLAKVKDTVTYGDKSYKTKIQEIYSEGKVYQKVDDGKFYAELSAEDFLDRCMPVQTLTPGLYTLSANDSNTVITFDGATAGESWALPAEEAQLLSASGTAELDGEGKITKTSYTVSFRYGAAEYAVSYEITPAELGREPSVPNSTEAYTLLQEIDGAVMLEHFYGYLSQFRHGSVTSYDLTMSAAAGIYLQNNFSLDAYAQGMEYAAKSESSVYVGYADDSTESAEVTEKMIEGKYTYSVDGGKETSSSLMTQELFESTVSDKILEIAYANAYISDIEITVIGDTILMEIAGNEDMGEALCYDTSSLLFEDGNLLNDYATDYRTETMDFYVAMDRFSLLPTAMGMEYEGVHKLDGTEYPLVRQADRSFDMASLTAYEEIYEETEPEEAPENPATPLFYHVTGSDGQEMWLFGTIHIGDVRTGFLPDEIYDAFYSADAFAIECNSEAFHEQAEEDEELQEQISQMYFYSDGSTVEEHIETPELYENAKKLMKATGNYFYNSEYLTAYLWSNSIENYFLRGGYSLTAEKGVEERLLKLAEEADIPVWEVESTLFQMQMTAEYSDHLQEVMLFMALNSGIQDYSESSQELYELWCAGDETALREEITGEEDWVIEEEDIDLTDLEGEELERAQAVLADLENINAQLAKLQEEYNTSMSVDRNAGMLEVAKEYLESGDVVFCAVGLAHLLEEDGLVNTLREAGYTVELVSYQ